MPVKTSLKTSLKTPMKTSLLMFLKSVFLMLLKTSMKTPLKVPTPMSDLFASNKITKIPTKKYGCYDKLLQKNLIYNITKR